MPPPQNKPITLFINASIGMFTLCNSGKKILKTKSTKITEETIELTDPKDLPTYF